MSKATTLLLVVTLFATVSVQSVYSAAADTVAFTNASWYKEKGAEKLVSAGDASLASGVSGPFLIAGKNSKTNYYVYQTSVAASQIEPEKAGVTTIFFKKVDMNKLAFVEGTGASATVTGFKWGGSSSSFEVGASVKNNVTLIGTLYLDPAAENPVKNLYAYLVDLDKNEKTEVVIASGNYTSAAVQTTITLNGVYSSGSLTVIVYTTRATTAVNEGKRTITIATLKDGKLGATTTVKEIPYTASSTGLESFQSLDGTGENLVIVLDSSKDGKSTETVYTYTVSDKEIKAGTSSPLNTQVTDTNDYDIEKVFAHADGRWVAVYSNTTTKDTVVNNYWVAKASNDTTFKVIATNLQDNTGKTGVTYSVQKHFAGLLLLTTDTSSSADALTPDQASYSYQIVNGDLTTIGTKTTYFSASGKYYSTSPAVYRVGDSKAVNVLIEQQSYDATKPIGERYTSEAVYIGQLFQKSYGATLQSILAACSLMLAALFFF